MTNNNVVTLDIVKNYMHLQEGVGDSYSTKGYIGECLRKTELDTAHFFGQYAKGEIKLSDEAFDLMPRFFHIAKRSSLFTLRKNLWLAQRRYKKEQKQRMMQKESVSKEKTTVDVLHTDKKNENAPIVIPQIYDREDLEKGNFSILLNRKKVAKMTSRDFVCIYDMLQKENRFSTDKMTSRLRSYIEERIKNVTSGKIEKDADFDKLRSVLRELSKRKKSTNKTSTKPQVKRVVEENWYETPFVVIPVPEDPKPSLLARKFNKIKRVFKSGLSSIRKGITNKFQSAKKYGKKIAVAVGLGAVVAFAWSNKEHLSFENNSSEGDKIENTHVTKVNKKDEVKSILDAENNPVVVENDAKTVKGAEEQVKLDQQNDGGKVSSFAGNVSTNNANVETIEAAYKNFYNTRLSMFLGEEGRDKLLATIDSLAKSGKIEYSQETTREWYAYAFTIYDKVAPYSKENKAIKSLLNGGTVDKSYINDLVVKAGRRGNGVVGTGTYSSFDRASPEVQRKCVDANNALNKVLSNKSLSR